VKEPFSHSSPLLYSRVSKASSFDHGYQFDVGDVRDRYHMETLEFSSFEKLLSFDRRVMQWSYDEFAGVAAIVEMGGGLGTV